MKYRARAPANAERPFRVEVPSAERPPIALSDPDPAADEPPPVDVSPEPAATPPVAPPGAGSPAAQAPLPAWAVAAIGGLSLLSLSLLAALALTVSDDAGRADREGPVRAQAAGGTAALAAGPPAGRPPAVQDRARRADTGPR